MAASTGTLPAAPARRLALPGPAEHLPVLLAGVLAAAWLAAGPPTADLAAQSYRAALYARHGFSVWDGNWYAGHPLPGYSLLFGPLAALVGVRLLGALCVIASAALFATLARRQWGSAALPAALWFAVIAVGDAVLGRLTFALGVSAGLAALAVLPRSRTGAAVLSAGCAAASPVAGLFLALAGAALALGGGRRREAAALALPALAMAGALAVLFGEGGSEPFTPIELLVSLGLGGAATALLPARERVLRAGGLLYAVALVACLVAPTPMGANAERLGVLFAGPLLLASGAWRRRAAALVLVGLAAWGIRGPVLEAGKAAGDPAASRSFYVPVAGFLRAQGPAPIRIESPFTLTHWDATWLGARFALARGWERQLDGRYDALFYRPRLSSSAYRDWLRAEGVSWVVLSDARPDPSSRAEVALVRSHPSYLREAWSSGHWQAFRVLGAPPLASGPGHLVTLASDSFVLQADRPGRFLVREHFTRYWTLSAGRGCVSAAPGGWTAVSVPAPGRVTVSARFSLAGALGEAGARCA